jgi:hypothetical protein
MLKMIDRLAVHTVIVGLVAIALAQLACAGRAHAQPPADAVRAVSYCEWSGGPGCQPMDDAPAGADLVELTWCCDFETGDCVAVVNVLACDPEMEYAVICEWGASVEQSSPIGAIDCYG